MLFVSFRFLSHSFTVPFASIPRRFLVVPVSSLLPCLFSASRLCISRPWSLVVYLPTQQLFSPSYLALLWLCPILSVFGSLFIRLPHVCFPHLPSMYVCVCILCPRICRFVVHQEFMCKSILNSIAGSIALRFWDGTGVDDERAKRKKKIVFCFSYSERV